MAGYSDVTLEHRTYGRVYIRHYQYGYNRYTVCSDGFSSTDGEALCRSKGYSYSYFSTYVIKHHIHFVSNQAMLCIFHHFSFLFVELLQWPITKAFPLIAIHTALTTVTSGHKATVLRQFTSTALVGTTALCLWKQKYHFIHKINVDLIWTFFYCINVQLIFGTRSKT